MTAANIFHDCTRRICALVRLGLPSAAHSSMYLRPPSNSNTSIFGRTVESCPSLTCQSDEGVSACKQGRAVLCEHAAVRAPSSACCCERQQVVTTELPRGEKFICVVHTTDKFLNQAKNTLVQVLPREPMRSETNR